MFLTTIKKIKVLETTLIILTAKILINKCKKHHFNSFNKKINKKTLKTTHKTKHYYKVLNNNIINSKSFHSKKKNIDAQVQCTVKIILILKIRIN